MDYLDNVAFVVLRLQESSQPDEAHEAFQVVLREVERLRAALEEIINTTGESSGQYAWQVARAALTKEEAK